MVERLHADGLAEIIREAHADDVRRARALVERAIAEADAEWVPRYALAEALVGVLQDLARPATTIRADA